MRVPKGRPASAALAQHRATRLVEVEVGDLQAEQLGSAHAGVDQQADDGIVAEVLELAVRAVASSARSWSSLSTGTGWTGTWAGHAGHRVAVDLALLDGKAKNCCRARKRL